MVKVAVVGAGNWGKNLVRVYAELGALGCICDVRREELVAIYGQRYPTTPFVSDYGEVLRAPEITAVAISTPALLHYSMAKEALIAGKDAFVEKPLALSFDEARELVEIARNKQRILMVGHILLYHPAILMLKKLIDDGTLGKIQYVYSNRLNIGRLRREENILWSFAPHDISAILMLLGEMPEAVATTGASYVQQRVADVTMTALDFPSGVKAHIFVSWLHPFKEHKLVVVGDRKMAVFDDLSDGKLFLYGHRIEWIERVPVAHKAQPEVVPLDLEEPLKVECLHFLECVKNRATPRTDGAEGMRVLKVLEACQKSLEENGCRIRLDERHSRNGGPFRESRIPETLDGDVLIHPTAIVEAGVKIGKGTKIWHFSHILQGCIIGNNCNIGQNVVIGPNVRIGNHVKIQNNVSVYEGVTLDDYVFCGPSAVFTNVLNPRSAIPRRHEIMPTDVKMGATIGANATIICGHTIGRYAFVGAGAVVTADVADYALVVGNPARQVGWVCECGNRLREVRDYTKCDKCGRRFITTETGLQECR